MAVFSKRKNKLICSFGFFSGLSFLCCPVSGVTCTVLCARNFIVWFEFSLCLNWIFLFFFGTSRIFAFSLFLSISLRQFPFDDKMFNEHRMKMKTIQEIMSEIFYFYSSNPSSRLNRFVVDKKKSTRGLDIYRLQCMLRTNILAWERHRFFSLVVWSLT